MRPHEIDSQLQRRPFIPFRIHLSESSHYEIRHPEMALVTRTVIPVAVYDDPKSTMPERAILCDPVHITRLEPLDIEHPPRL